MLFESKMNNAEELFSFFLLSLTEVKDSLTAAERQLKKEEAALKRKQQVEKAAKEQQVMFSSYKLKNFKKKEKL